MDSMIEQGFKQHSPSLHSPVAVVAKLWKYVADRDVIFLKTSCFFVASPEPLIQYAGLVIIRLAGSLTSLLLSWPT